MNKEEFQKLLFEDIMEANKLENEIMNLLYGKASNHRQLVISMLLMQKTIKFMLAPENSSDKGKTILFFTEIIDEIIDKNFFSIDKRPARKNEL